MSRSGGQSGLEDRGRGSRILVGAEIEVSTGGNGDGEVKSTVFLSGNFFQVSEMTRPVQLFLYYILLFFSFLLGMNIPNWSSTRQQMWVRWALCIGISVCFSCCTIKIFA